MFRKLTAAALLTLAAGAAFASDDVAPAKAAEITALLTAQGYEVRSVQMEDGLYEAYAIKDGEKLEIYLNDAMEIVETKKD
jgi:hypothetical protein